MGKNTYFAFKQFSVDQAACGMKVTTDACLFGAWAPVEQARQILDIGTGTGLLALMAAQRSQASVDAVELDPLSATTAEANFARSPWSESMRIFRTRVQDFCSGPEGYDVILCNPPFYPSGTRSPAAGRANSRHTDVLPHDELLDAIDRLLAPEGKACVLLPERTADTFTTRAQFKNLHESERLYFRSALGRPPHCRAVVFSRTPAPRVEKTLIIHAASREYTPETASLLAPFYLHL